MTIPFSIQKRNGFPHTPPNSSPPPPSSFPLTLPSTPSSSSTNLLDHNLQIDHLKQSFQKLTPHQQEWLLCEIVNHCDHTQLTFLYDTVTLRLKVDFLKRLPIELALYIVSFIHDPLTLGSMACVSKHWNDVLKDETIWKNMCDIHQYRQQQQPLRLSNSNNRMVSGSSFWGLTDSDKDNEQSQYSDSMDTTTTYSYRDYFVKKYNITTAWKKGGRVKVVDQGVEGLVTCLQCDDKYIVVGCENHRIEVFDAVTGNKIRSLSHVGGVWALQFKGDDDVIENPADQQRVLVSAGCDRDVRVWNLETGELRHIMRGHISTVRCLKMKDKQVAVTGSRDCTLRIWDLEQGTVKHVLQGHQNSVRCLDICGNILVSGSYDNTARVWDLTTGECLHVLMEHVSNIYSIVTDGIKVAAGSLGSHIRVWSVDTGDCLAVLHGHTSLVGQLELVPGDDTMGTTLVSGGADGCLRIFNWNEPDFECLQRISAHDNSITCLQCDDRWILSSGNDGHVKLFDRKQGRLIRTLTAPAKTVYKIEFNESKAIILMSRALSPASEATTTVLEIHDFDI